MFRVYPFNHSKGFTIIELLVVMFIMSLISGAVLASYFTGEKQYALTRAVQQIAVDLRRVQNLALSGATQGVTIPQGYGLYTSSASQYILFYNTGSSKTRGGGSTDLETISLSGSVSLSPSGQNIYFTPPESLTWINGANSGSQVFTISSGNYTKTVTVYASGRIEIQ